MTIYELISTYFFLVGLLTVVLAVFGAVQYFKIIKTTEQKFSIIGVFYAMLFYPILFLVGFAIDFDEFKNESKATTKRIISEDEIPQEVKRKLKE